MKPWYEYLWELLIGAFTQQDLRAAGAPPHASSVTFSMPLGSGYAAPEPPPGVAESRDLADCHPTLAARFAALKADFERETGRELIVTCTYRSPERQHELWSQGRTAAGSIVTMLDGFVKKGRHNVYPAEAVDVAVELDPGVGKHVTWNHADYEPLGPLAARHGLIWGGGWHALHDDPHLELPAGDA